MRNVILQKQELYYITPMDNLCSILQEGIFCHEEPEKRFPNRKRIENKQVYERRRHKGLSKYANLYINPRNPMLYLLYKGLKRKIVIIGVDASIVQKQPIQIAIGNAASENARIYTPKQIILDKLFKDIRGIDYWDNIPKHSIEPYLRNSTSHKGIDKVSLTSKVFIMSEVLIPQRVPKKYLKSVYTPSEEAKKVVVNILKDCSKAAKVEVAVAPSLFFEPEKKEELLPRLHLVYGDMFFAGTEVLTISVNVVGVMGKGLASRFKYLFPEAYVRYEELCRSKKLRVGAPYLLEVAKTNGSLKYRKFLLFPTKKHWRGNARIEYIEEGLKYLISKVENKEWQMKSIALPALGCGLGKLKWKDVGPLMVKYLHRLTNHNVEVMIYTPDLKDEYFQKAFYLFSPAREDSNPQPPDPKSGALSN